MTSIDLQRQAGEYVLGTLAPETRKKFAVAMSRDPGLQELVAQWERHLAPLEADIAPIQPRDAVWSGIEAALDGAPRDALNISIRANEGIWIKTRPGVEKKQLLIDRAVGTQSFLVRLAPGTKFASHRHRQVEECLMIEGDLTIGEESYGPGDYVAALAGSIHPVIHTKSGAMFYISGELNEAFD